MLGLSSVSGMGLYICENAKKGDYLGEYKGELITEDEADRRGKLYDKRGISFLFNLNRDQVIDATRMGNKFRYINHSKLRPNCHAKVRVANCVQRIAFWALRELVAGEELFFDYGLVFLFYFVFEVFVFQWARADGRAGIIRNASSLCRWSHRR
jgi:SET domain-containing protein